MGVSRELPLVKPVLTKDYIVRGRLFALGIRLWEDANDFGRHSAARIAVGNFHLDTLMKLELRQILESSRLARVLLSTV